MTYFLIDGHMDVSFALQLDLLVSNIAGEAEKNTNGQLVIQETALEIPGGSATGAGIKADDIAHLNAQSFCVSGGSDDLIQHHFHIVKDKEALKFLRKIKIERKSDFNKALSKKHIEEISASIYNSIVPYYQVSNGGLLSDEYTFLSYADSLEATKEFFENIEKEELLEAKPCGAVIATCADGDSILLTDKEKVIRFSHETPEVTSEWQNIAMFFVEAINDSE